MLAHYSRRNDCKIVSHRAKYPLLLTFQGADALSVFVAFFVLNGALLSFQPLFVGSRSLLVVSVLEAMVVLVDGAVIKLLVALNPGTVLGLLPDLFPQIGFERCLLRLRG
jgi:hypothetical protein